jgi:hypothetical protein
MKAIKQLREIRAQQKGDYARAEQAEARWQALKAWLNSRHYAQMVLQIPMDDYLPEAIRLKLLSQMDDLGKTKHATGFDLEESSQISALLNTHATMAEPEKGPSVGDVNDPALRGEIDEGD